MDAELSQVKKLDLPLQDGEAAQAVNYANNQGAEWAILTNGRRWYIYNAHLPNPPTEKRVFQIDDLFIGDLALNTFAFLSGSSMLAGGLTEAWAFQQMQALVKAQLETPHSAVRKQLRKLAADGIRATILDDVIDRALRSLSSNPPPVAEDETDPQPVPPPKPPAPLVVTGTPLYTFAEIAADSAVGSGKEPGALQFSDGTLADTVSWADAIGAAVEYVARIYRLPSLPFTGRNKSRMYFLNTAQASR